MKTKTLKEALSINRIVYYLLILGFVPLFFAFQDYTAKKKRLKSIQNVLERTVRISVTNQKRQSVNNAIRKIYANANHSYIDHELETLSFLEKERADLEKILSSSAFPGDEKIMQRFLLLSGEENRLIFREGGIEKGEGMEETIEILSHPVEMSIEDLKLLLGKIEGKDISQRPPQMLITDFSIKRKNPLGESEVFEVDMKLIKREFNA